MTWAMALEMALITAVWMVELKIGGAIVEVWNVDRGGKCWLQNRGLVAANDKHASHLEEKIWT
jgi:hypothetical protein